MSQFRSSYGSHGCEPSTSFQAELSTHRTSIQTSFSSYSTKVIPNLPTRSSDTTIRRGPSTPPLLSETGDSEPLPWRRVLGRIEDCRDQESRNKYKQQLERYGNHNFSERKRRALIQGKDLYGDLTNIFKEPEKEWPLIESRIFGDKPRKYSFVNIMVKDSKGNLKATKRVNGICLEYPEYTREEVSDPRNQNSLRKNVAKDYLELDIVIDNSFCAAPPRREACVTQLNDNVREDYLLSVCSKFGQVNYLHIYTNPDGKSRTHLGFALIEFDSESALMEFVKCYTERPTIMGFQVKVFVDTLGFWAIEEYKRVTGFDAPLPPRHENLTDPIAIARIRHLVKVENRENNIIDSQYALETSVDTSQHKEGPTTPDLPPSSIRKGPRTPEPVERRRSLSRISSRSSVSPDYRRKNKYRHKSPDRSFYGRRDRKRRRSLCSESASSDSESQKERFNRRKSAKFEANNGVKGDRKRRSRFDTLERAPSPSFQIKPDPDSQCSQSSTVPRPKLIDPTNVPKEDYADYINSQEGIFWDPKVPFLWKDYPLQYFNRFATAQDQAKVIEYGWQQHPGDVLRFPTCHIQLGYAYYTTKIRYPQPPVDHMKENVDLAKQSLRTEMLFHLTQAVGQLIEQKLYLEMEKMHNVYEAEMKKKDAEKAKQKVQLRQFDLEAYLEGQSRRQSVFGSVSANKNETDFVCSDKFRILMSSLVVFNCLLVFINAIFLILFLCVYKRLFCRAYDEDFDLESLASTHSRKGRHNNGYSPHAFNNVFKEPPSPGPPTLKPAKRHKSVSEEGGDLLPDAKNASTNGTNNTRFKKCVSFEDAEPSPRREMNILEVHDEFAFADEEILDYTSQQSHKS
uniref:RRM domain-containing protein n=1 Tax=Bursaphelenchus xylophilus TaxID=6326 RepID=A0A1I7RLW2_BURXY